MANNLPAVLTSQQTDLPQSTINRLRVETEQAIRRKKQHSFLTYGGFGAAGVGFIMMLAGTDMSPGFGPRDLGPLFYPGMGLVMLALIMVPLSFFRIFGPDIHLRCPNCEKMFDPTTSWVCGGCGGIGNSSRPHKPPVFRCEAAGCGDDQLAIECPLCKGHIILNRQQYEAKNSSTKPYPGVARYDAPMPFGFDLLVAAAEDEDRKKQSVSDPFKNL